MSLLDFVKTSGRASKGRAGQGAAALSSLAKREDATAVVEFAMVLPVMVFLLSGIVDFGALIVQSMQVSTAAQAGARYAQINGWNATGISSAVTGATNLSGVSATPTPASETACVSGASIVVTSGSTCGATASGTYITVSAQAAFTPVTSLWKSVLPAKVSSQAMVRIS